MKTFLRMVFDSSSEKISDIKNTVEEHWTQNKDSYEKDVNIIFESGREHLKSSQEILNKGAHSVFDNAKGIFNNFRYSDSDLRKCESNIENQGGLYRELNRNSTKLDSIMIGGTLLANYVSNGIIDDNILEAYSAAYPNLASHVSFKDQVEKLDGEALIGFISGVKGKLFEQQYVNYLNDENLPEGYTAVLATNTNQPGWDIAIEGPNEEIISVLQAKATDSVSYVQEALEKYPNIDVVTTEEVYSHLVMSGISENIASSSITNADLVDSLNEAVDSSQITMDFMPPVFALAFIAFTSYKDESLTLYQKAECTADRTGKTYLSYLIGGSIGMITNTWWLGVIGSVSSRVLSNSGNKKYETLKVLLKTEQNNQKIIDSLKPQF